MPLVPSSVLARSLLPCPNLLVELGEVNLIAVDPDGEHWRITGETEDVSFL